MFKQGSWGGIDLVDEILSPGDPDGGADAGLQRQAGPGAFGGLTGAAKTPGQPGQQAVDTATAVEPDADDGKLACVWCELVVQPLGVGDTERDGDLGPVGDGLDPGPRSRGRCEPAKGDLACPLRV